MSKQQLLDKIKKAARLIKPGQVLDIQLSKKDAAELTGGVKKKRKKNPEGVEHGGRSKIHEMAIVVNPAEKQYHLKYPKPFLYPGYKKFSRQRMIKIRSHLMNLLSNWDYNWPFDELTVHRISGAFAMAIQEGRPSETIHFNKNEYDTLNKLLKFKPVFKNPSKRTMLLRKSGAIPKGAWIGGNQYGPSSSNSKSRKKLADEWLGGNQY